MCCTFHSQPITETFNITSLYLITTHSGSMRCPCVWLLNFLSLHTVSCVRVDLFMSICCLLDCPNRFIMPFPGVADCSPGCQQCPLGWSCFSPNGVDWAVCCPNATSPIITCAVRAPVFPSEGTSPTTHTSDENYQILQKIFGCILGLNFRMWTVFRTLIASCGLHHPTVSPRLGSRVSRRLSVWLRSTAG